MMVQTPETLSVEALVQSQFGATASDYVTSAVHARGADLARIAAVAEALRPALALDLGCGGGHVTYALAPHAGRVVACDLSEAMLEAVRAEAARRGLAGVETAVAAAEALPFADGLFDLVACRFSAHHWRDIVAGLAEARRVLKPGGVALFVDVVAPEAAAADSHLQTVELLRDPSHGRDHTACAWRAMLEAAGFAVTGETAGRLRMDFADWTARMRTPPVQAQAIRAVQALAPREVADHFAIEPDGSFLLDTLVIEARAA